VWRQFAHSLLMLTTMTVILTGPVPRASATPESTQSDSGVRCAAPANGPPTADTVPDQHPARPTPVTAGDVVTVRLVAPYPAPPIRGENYPAAPIAGHGYPAPPIAGHGYPAPPIRGDGPTAPQPDPLRDAGPVPQPDPLRDAGPDPQSDPLAAPAPASGATDRAGAVPDFSGLAIVPVLSRSWSWPAEALAILIAALGFTFVGLILTRVTRRRMVRALVRSRISIRGSIGSGAFAAQPHSDRHPRPADSDDHNYRFVGRLDAGSTTFEEDAP